MPLGADCHGVTEVNLLTALGFCSMVSSIESMERLERAHEQVMSLSVEVFPGASQTGLKYGSWREAPENETNLKHSMGYHETACSEYLVGSSAVLYCNSNYPTHMMVVDTRTQHRLITSCSRCPSACDCRGCQRDPVNC